MQSSQDFYQVLGVDRAASQDEIKKAFRQKAKQYHPDMNKAPDAEVKFKALGEAYDVLGNADKRRMYDQYGHAAFQQQAQGGGGGYGGGYEQWDWMDNFGDLSDIFSAFFGADMGGRRGGQRGTRGGRRSKARRGDDLQTAVNLTFKEAIFGVEKTITIHHAVTCGDCNGSGASKESGGPVSCHHCGGTGQLQQTAQTMLGYFTQIVPCHHCHGTGELISDPCKTCHGSGQVEQEKELKLTIPPGVDHGLRLRMLNEGNAGVHGGPAGDLYVLLQVEADPLFTRDGDTLYSTVPVTYSQLALGATLQIEGLEGPISLEIPAGTPIGHQFRLKNQGIPKLRNNKQRGDHMVTVEVSVPKKLSGTHKKLLQALNQLQNHEAEVKPTPHIAELLGIQGAAQKDGLWDKVSQFFGEH